jgi:pimeloyl-ACP methyl ester carboxylesterase
MAAHVQAVVNELAVDAPAVVGHSLGGSTAAIFALAYSARAIVIVDQPLRFGDFAARIRSLEDRLRGEGFVDAMLEFEEGLQIDPLDGPARAELEAAVRSADRDVVLGVWAQLFSPATRSSGEGCGSEELHGYLRTVRGSIMRPRYDPPMRFE